MSLIRVHGVAPGGTSGVDAQTARASDDSCAAISSGAASAPRRCGLGLRLSAACRSRYPRSPSPPAWPTVHGVHGDEGCGASPAAPIFMQGRRAGFATSDIWVPPTPTISHRIDTYNKRHESPTKCKRAAVLHGSTLTFCRRKKLDLISEGFYAPSSSVHYTLRDYYDAVE
jgi:hypothetical protein